MNEPARANSPVELHQRLERIWGTGPGFGRLAAVNHTLLGRRFIITAFLFFAVGGILAMLIRAQIATSHSAFVGPEIYNQLFTMHGTVMMFLFAIPMFEGFAIYLLPKMLGARDLAFPRFGAYGYWCYLFGGSIMLIALAVGAAPNGGWFMYTPLTSKPFSPGINADVWLIGITFVEISAIGAATEIAVSILMVRAPGMSLDRLPIFAWYMLVVAMMILAGFPPLILGSILLEAERAFGWAIFDPTRGGDSLLWQHLFWLFGHPEVYIIFLPAAGMISTILPVLVRRELIGYRWVVLAAISVGFLSFGLWVHHMFAVGIPHLALAFFSAASMLVAIPTGVQIFAWIGTLMSGRPQMSVPMLFLLGFFFIFVLGGLTGVMVAVVPFDWQVHDTHFVVAHLHYVLVGGFVFPMLAAAYYWLPHFTGREHVYKLGYFAFWLIFIGFNMTFFLMHLTGLLGMPRRVWTYPGSFGWDGLNLLSSIGGFVMTMGFALVALDFLLQVRFGPKTARNPWEAGTLEWATPVPPADYGFASLPVVTSHHPLADDPDLPRKLAAGEGLLGFARHEWLETIAVDMVTGKPRQIIILPGSTFLPLWTALATGLFFLSLLFQVYQLAVVGMVLTIVLFWLWTRHPARREDLGSLPIGDGTVLLAHTESGHAPSWWAVVFLQLADAALFGSLLFGLLFLWVVAPNWPPPELLAVSPGFALGACGMLLLAALTGRGALAAARRSAPGWTLIWTRATTAAHAAAILLVATILTYAPDPTVHAYAGVSAAVHVYVLVHAAIGLILALHGWHSCRRGEISAARSLNLMIGQLWHDYSCVTGIAGLAATFGLAWAIGSGGLQR
ncbi:MAG TPA: cytochrome c oxidase subunit I [Geminicoccus sp.]|jgi:cytochrome c oxidase subunit I+III|uniref:cytochrome c oxidase subunit I n=1 Tax=Geminicoccus sp. TaxID=2024832 RepID=UPI002E333C0F|nr:cytochrome c oxidase subunit I [Geminicoccus sp.]HEX2525431.1 cytochrome c oxidase subunit I [Geminicoccus sp.]